ncbi:hypothetical protein [Paenibacillus caui]|uniref:hypothetical protein n=1 Tax=Paenibacillus caui TaxID=2873927 RepID=UPI001CA97F0B|nr:hypothetical protein [Paenibacillus caui]
MKINKKYIVVIIIVCIIAVFEIVHRSQMNTSFKKVVLDRLNGTEITSIHITRTSVSVDPYEEKEIVVTDKHVINNIINDFSEIKLRKSRNHDFNPNESYHYIMHIEVDRPRVSSLRFGMTVYDKKNISIFDYDNRKNKYNSYKITNEFSPDSLENVFK